MIYKDESRKEIKVGMIIGCNDGEVEKGYESNNELAINKCNMGFKERLDYEILMCKNDGVRFKKLLLKDVIDIISYGLYYKIYYCPSNEEPQKNKHFMSYNYRYTNEFRRWHKKTKEKICNDVDGNIIKYYIDVNDEDLSTLKK